MTDFFVRCNLFKSFINIPKNLLQFVESQI